MASFRWFQVISGGQVVPAFSKYATAALFWNFAVTLLN